MRKSCSLATTLLAVILEVMVAGCRRTPKPEFEDLLGSLIDQAGYSAGDHIGFLNTAPVVLLATVVSNDPVGQPKESSRVRGYRVELRKVVGRVEEILRDDLERVPTGNVEFYYYSAVEPRAYQPYHKFFYQADRRRRYLFFLMRDGDLLRSVGDVGPYSIPVYSGLPQRPSSQTSAYGTRVSEILLSLGEGFDEEGFAASLLQARVTADLVGSRYSTVKLLQALLKGPPMVRAAACRELNHTFWGQYGCLEALKSDQQQTEETRAWASEALGKVPGLNGRLKDYLRDPAQIPSGFLIHSDSMAANYDELRILLEHPDPECARLACVAIHRYYPRTQAAGCRVQ